MFAGPSRQRPLRAIATLAALSVFPLTFGTTHGDGFGGVDAAKSKVATTSLAASIVIVQAPAPEHAPLQPAKNEEAFGAAASVTTAPSS